MKIEYSHVFAISREIVWRLLQDETVLQKAIPGCQSLIRLEEGIYQAEMGLNVGPVKGMFAGRVELTDLQEPHFYRLLVKGKGMPGEIDAVADMQLDETENGDVKLTCTANVKVTGVLASVGQRVMSGVAKLVLGQFFKAADKEMKDLASQS